MNVAPVKGSALFWYNWNAACRLENPIEHFECPVALGSKKVRFNIFTSRATQHFKTIFALHGLYSCNLQLRLSVYRGEHCFSVKLGCIDAVDKLNGFLNTRVIVLSVFELVL